MKIGRNDPCPCGSGQKYKKCCAAAVAAVAKVPCYGPSELVMARAEAFRLNNFGFIFDTFHPDSSFRQQFPDRADYVKYGLATLNEDYRIEECQVLKEQIDDAVAQVLFYLRVHYQGEALEYLELSEFHRLPEGWRYLHSHKMERQELERPLDEITFDDVLSAGICF